MVAEMNYNPYESYDAKEELENKLLENKQKKKCIEKEIQRLNNEDMYRSKSCKLYSRCSKSRDSSCKCPKAQISRLEKSLKILNQESQILNQQVSNFEMMCGNKARTETSSRSLPTNTSSSVMRSRKSFSPKGRLRKENRSIETRVDYYVKCMQVQNEEYLRLQETVTIFQKLSFNYMKKYKREEAKTKKLINECKRQMQMVHDMKEYLYQEKARRKILDENYRYSTGTQHNPIQINDGTLLPCACCSSLQPTINKRGDRYMK